MPIFCPASMPEMRARMPISEKSSVPSMRRARQPSSRARAFAGAAALSQTREISSSVRLRKKNPPSGVASGRLDSLQTQKDASIHLSSMFFIPLFLNLAAPF